MKSKPKEKPKQPENEHQLDVRFKIVAVQVCVKCAFDASAFTAAGLCARCEQGRRNRIISGARVVREKEVKK